MWCLCIFNIQHDPEMCTPGGEDGNYIMFARATSGDKKNNNKFSPCSLRAIEPVLNSKARSGKGCFTGKLFECHYLVQRGTQTKYYILQSPNKPSVEMVLLIQAKSVTVAGKKIVKIHVAIRCQPIRALMKSHAR